MDNWSCSILSLSIISDISNITIIVISVIVDMLDSAIRKSNRVGSLISTSTIRRLSSLEVRLGVVISNSIGVSVRGNNIWGSIGWSSMSNNWSMISWGSMNCMGNHWSMYSMGNNRGSMNSMTKTMKGSCTHSSKDD